MKTCPRCNRVYHDETLRFCRNDGTQLVRTHTDDLPTGLLRPPGSSSLQSPTRPFPTSTSLSSPLSPRRSSRKAIDSLAVLPFTNAGATADMEYFSDGITESIINALSRLPKLRVIARSIVFRYKGRDVDPLQAGDELAVRAILTGRVRQTNDSLMIGTELIDVANGAQLWGEHYNRKLSDVFEVQEEIAKVITERLRLKLAIKDKKQLVKRQTEDPEAYQAYLKGRYYWDKRTKGAMGRAIQYFQQAIEIDPAYAVAYSGLADCFNALGWFRVAPAKEVFPKAKAAAMKALEIDDQLSEAHTSLAYARFLHDWDWKNSERGFKRAIKLNPKYATARQWYSVYLWAMGRFDESIEQVRRAVELDPLSRANNLTLGMALYFARQFEESVQQLKKTLEIEPRFFPARVSLSLAYEQLGRFEEAVSEAEAARAAEDLPLVLAQLGGAYARAGRKQDAHAIIDTLQAQAKERYVSPFEIATIYADLHETESALEWFEKALEERASWMVFLNTTPKFDLLRSAPGYSALLERIGFA
jgi:TolB-like protein/Tfp pilus assembly protein PilF